tara:strand:- start:3356 stop:3637 length:282 start_codon:yes stop_codon:yes gene_type:complete
MKGYVVIRMIEQKWVYRGHACYIHIEQIEEDTSKAFHYITKPNGEQILAPLDSYDCERSLVEGWIDLGYPDRIGIAPLNKWDIELLKSVGGEA